MAIPIYKVLLGCHDGSRMSWCCLCKSLKLLQIPMFLLYRRWVLSLCNLPSWLRASIVPLVKRRIIYIRLMYHFPYWHIVINYNYRLMKLVFVQFPFILSHWHLRRGCVIGTLIPCTWTRLLTLYWTWCNYKVNVGESVRGSNILTGQVKYDILDGMWMSWHFEGGEATILAGGIVVKRYAT